MLALALYLGAKQQSGGVVTIAERWENPGSIWSIGTMLKRRGVCEASKSARGGNIKTLPTNVMGQVWQKRPRRRFSIEMTPIGVVGR
eukprot:2059516-Prymnesium_polylepis.2